MKNTEFEQQSQTYSNYIKLFYPTLQWANTVYKDLFNMLTEGLQLSLVSLGGYFFEQFLFTLKNNLSRIEIEVLVYVENNDFDKIQKEYIFYHKSFLENRINELFIEYNFESKLKLEKEKMISNYDKILKELNVIGTIFKSQMDPTIHLGSGMGLARYCNEIFIFSDVELFKIGSYKTEYTSRLENSNNKLLLLNELVNIYNLSYALYSFYVNNLLNHPNKKEIFKGKDAKQQIIDSTGYYNFINYRASFCFFGVEKNDIGSNFLQNKFSYNCKNEILVNFCVQLLEFIKLCGVIGEIDANSVEEKNYHPDIFSGNDNKAFNLFNDFAKEVTDCYPDYSFIFQKMRGENLINKRVRHKEFMEWLFNNEFINNVYYEEFIDKESFSKKYDRGMRTTRYYMIKNKYF
ncbi:hypothetical protein [Flavobacterium flavigenum]|uniref:hypothetical protein n=1 Tax=Flavobacterium flavigenum TaxID=3003258 RepID=UPI0022ABE43C|nr:hypothetical protein [Flavobacterium flavigenum]